MAVHHSPAPPGPARPGLLRRLAAGAWHVPAGFAFLLRRPALWPLALLPVALTGLGLFFGLILGLFAIRSVERAFAHTIASAPELVGVLITIALWAGTLMAGMLAGLALALLLAAPVMERLSRRVERLIGGAVPEHARGFAWETLQALRGALYFVAAAPLVFLLTLVPLVGPVCGALWGAYALAHQLTDAPLTRRGQDFRGRRAWHSEWRPESIGFGLAGLMVLVVPGANLMLAPALAVGGTLLVAELETHPKPAGPAPIGPLPPAPRPAEPRPARSDWSEELS